MKPRIGIQWDTTGIMSISHPNPVEQVYNSVAGTLKTIGAVASPKSDVRLQHLSGPVGIGRIYYLLFQSERGWQLALWFSVILNVNLAILNMLPIPVLDGGHIVLAIIESVRRRPVKITGATLELGAQIRSVFTRWSPVTRWPRKHRTGKRASWQKWAAKLCG